MCCVPESGVLTNPVGPYQDGEDRCIAGSGHPGVPCGRGSAGAGETLAYLCGRWRVDRDLVDHLSGRTGHLTGEAGFLPVPFCHVAAPSPGSPLPARPVAVTALRYAERG